MWRHFAPFCPLLFPTSIHIHIIRNIYKLAAKIIHRPKKSFSPHIFSFLFSPCTFWFAVGGDCNNSNRKRVLSSDELARIVRSISHQHTTMFPVIRQHEERNLEIETLQLKTRWLGLTSSWTTCAFSTRGYNLLSRAWMFPRRQHTCRQPVSGESRDMF